MIHINYSDNTTYVQTYDPIALIINRIAKNFQEKGKEINRQKVQT